jgi:hypothetical protein
MLVIVLAVVAVLLVGGGVAWMTSVGSGEPESSDETAESDAGRISGTSPSPSTIASASPAASPDAVDPVDEDIDPHRVSTIISDAHSGRYFSNEYEDTYPRMMEAGMVAGMILAAADDKQLSSVITDEFLACSLSYVETNWSYSYVSKHAKAVGSPKVGVKILSSCVDYMNV